MATLPMKCTRFPVALIMFLVLLASSAVVCCVPQAMADAPDIPPAAVELKGIRRKSDVSCSVPVPGVVRVLQPDGDQGLSLGQPMTRVRFANFSQDVPTAVERKEALELYRTFIDGLKDKHSHGAMPLYLIAHLEHDPSEMFIDGQLFMGFNPDGIQPARDGYAAQPSSFLAGAYAELAILQQELGMAENARATLMEAYEVLELSKVNFRNDRDFRRNMPWPVNFIRPESFILFLLGEDARQGDRPDEALRWYQHVIMVDPAGPCAWESLVRLRMLKDVEQTTINQYQAEVFKSFPAAWGALSIFSNRISHEQFQNQISLLLKRAARELQDEEARNRAQSDAPPGEAASRPHEQR